ncbi:MAG: DUF386 family protein [Planctomycetes bacterium]|nr:DUF386 family protein [Planctomycetota bacterium]
MIIDTIKNAAQYEKLSEAIAKGLKILNDKSLINQSDGRYDIDGDNLFFLIQRYTTKPIEQGKTESHQKYIDIQYTVSGREMIGYAPTSLLKIDTPYDSDKDVALYKSNGKITHLNLEGETFAVFYPDDAHMPGCQLNGPTEVHKIVVKIRI